MKPLVRQTHRVTFLSGFMSARWWLSALVHVCTPHGPPTYSRHGLSAMLAGAEAD